MDGSRLLIVDDDEQFAHFVRHVATSAGYEVVVASTASAIWDSLAPDLDLLFLDLNLPDADGLTILRELDARNCGAMIHVLSGADPRVLRSASRLAQELGLRIGEPLSKPVGIRELRRALANSRRSAGQDGSPAPSAEASFVPVVEDLRLALERNEFFVVFQPIVELATLEPKGAEALVRWRHPEHGIVPPLSFVPVAEELGVISELTDEVLSQSLDFVRLRGVADRPSRLSVSVNLAPAVLADRGLPDRLGRLLTDNEMDPSRLVVEVTESVAMADRINVLEVLSRICLRGVELSIDDFGTGSSSLERLDQLPCAELKIERAFVSQIGRRAEAETIVRATIELGRRLGLRTVAEGVEDLRMLGWLRDAGCELGQGYLFARGLEGLDFEKWLADWEERSISIDPAVGG